MSQNKNSGTLGRNQKFATQAPGAPEYKGKIEIDGQLYWLSAWIKTNSQTGEKFFSLDAQAADPAPQQAAPAAAAPADDEIPF